MSNMIMVLSVLENSSRSALLGRKKQMLYVFIIQANVVDPYRCVGGLSHSAIMTFLW